MMTITSKQSHYGCIIMLIVTLVLGKKVAVGFLKKTFKENIMIIDKGTNEYDADEPKMGYNGKFFELDEEDEDEV